MRLGRKATFGLISAAVVLIGFPVSAYAANCPGMGSHPAKHKKHIHKPVPHPATTTSTTTSTTTVVVSSTTTTIPTGDVPSPVSPTTSTTSPSSSSVSDFPNAANTGPVASDCPNGYTTASGDLKVSKDNTVIKCVRLSGSYDVSANNVTIEDSIITSTNWWGVLLRTGTNMKLLHDTISGVPGKGPDGAQFADGGGEDYAIDSFSSGTLEVGYNNLSEFGDVIQLGQGNVHDNYIHDVQAFKYATGSGSAWDHTDAFISTGANNQPLVIEHNSFLNQTPLSKGASASVGLFADFGPVKNVTVDNNLLAGGAYSLYPGGGPTSSNIVITNNKFSMMFDASGGAYGPVAGSYWHTGSGNRWSGNVWYDGPNKGQLVNP